MAKQGVEQSEAAKLRIRREDCDRVKHDSLFSDWKILVGASDWQEHAAGKEGASRYRLHNLPSPRFSSPGVYELGIFPRRRALVTASARQQQQQQQGSGRRIRREDVVAVYVGQAENVRQRLQRYGQAGSHLETGVVAVGVTVAASQCASKPAPAAAAVVRVSKSEWAEAGDPAAAAVAGKGGGGSDALQQHQHQLFSKVFAEGRAIVFRWAMAESKEAAKKVEDDLLAVFDYAWNRGQNGYRRPHDVYSKLHHQEDGEVSCFGALSFLAYLKWVLSGRHRRGVVVAVRNPNRVLKQHDLINASVLKVADALQVDETWKKRQQEDKKDRGVHGTPPQRKQRHRDDDDDELRSRANYKREEARWQEWCDDGEDKERVRNKVQEAKKPPPSSSPSCGYVLEDGSECVTPPPKGRRRCEEHKGMRIKAVVSVAAAPRRTRA